MRYLGFNHGQFGDLVMSLVPCKIIKDIDKESHITFCISKKYSSIKPLFENNYLIDDFLITDGYCGLSNKDIQTINNGKFDKVYHLWQPHQDLYWYHKRHQLQETCLMHGLPAPSLDNINFELNRWFMNGEDTDRNKIVIAPFGGGNINESKSFSVQRAQEIVDFLNKKGYYCVQVGDMNEPKLNNCNHVFGNWIDSLKEILTSLSVITIDTAINWICAGYNQNLIGVYCSWEIGEDAVKNIQPPNKNATYLVRNHCNDFSAEEIYQTLKNKHG